MSETPPKPPNNAQADWVMLVRRSPVLSALGEAELAALAEALIVRTLRAGEQLISHLAEDASVFFVLEGELSVHLSSAIGRQVAIRRLGSGDHLGEIAALTGAPRTAKVTAKSPARVAECPREAFEAVLNSNPRFAAAIARDLARKVVNLTDRVFELSALEVRFRIYAELLRLARAGERVAEGVLIKDAPTHETIAASVGAHREAVSREFAALASEGVLRAGKRQILVLNETRLRELVERRGGLTASQVVDWVF